jgi:hypothetical protein
MMWHLVVVGLVILLVVAALVQGVRAFIAGLPSPDDLGNEDDSVLDYTSPQ